MIFDSFENIGKYYNISHRMTLALDFLRKHDFMNEKDGKIEISDGVYANVQTYMTKPYCEGKFEAHRDYIDIQFVIDGEEEVGIAAYEDFESLIPYVKERDIEFLTSKKNHTQEMIILKPNLFVVLYPQDAHMPSLAVKNQSKKVKKVVIKIKIND